MPFMLRAGTFRLMFQRVSDLSIVIFRCRSTLFIQNRKAAFVLVIDHSSKLGVCDNVILARYSSDVVRGVGIACGLDHTVVVVEREFILQPVDQCALVKWHVTLEQLAVEWNEKRLRRASAMALSAATLESPFPAPI